MTLARTVLLAALTTAAVSAEDVRTLATSASWQVTHEEDGAVRLRNVRTGREALVTNSRVTFWSDEDRPWRPQRANVSSNERYALIQWADDVPKYTSSEIDLVSLEDFRVQKLPLSDLRGSLALPVWSADSRFLAASGGNTVRLWQVEDGSLSVKLLAIPKVGNLWLSGADQVQFVAAGKQLSVHYTMIQSNAYSYADRTLQARYSVPGGKLLGTQVVKRVR